MMISVSGLAVTPEDKPDPIVRNSSLFASCQAIDPIQCHMNEKSRADQVRYACR